MAVAVAVVAVSALLLLLLRGTGRRASGLVTLQDPLAKYPLRLVDKEVTDRPGRPLACMNPLPRPASAGVLPASLGLLGRAGGDGWSVGGA